jgi:hypothetical protein
MSNNNSSTNTNGINALASQDKALNSKFGSISTAIKNMKSRNIPLKQQRGNAHERIPGLKEEYKNFKDDVIADYIYGLYHPDIVFNEHLDIKMPSRMPIPTTSFHFKDTFNITTNNSGNFVLVWNPNFLGTADELVRNNLPNNIDANLYDAWFSNCYWNNDNGLTGNATLTGGWNCNNFRHVRQDFAKYRLTSACLKVKYTGKVLDQSGMMSACASYFTFPRSVWMAPTNSVETNYYPLLEEDRNIARFADFDNIRQGQWAHTISLVSEPDGITCVYHPTDPLSEVFVVNGTTIDSDTPNVTWQNSNAQSVWRAKNANLSYAVCGYGIAPATTCITVECYYNFEIIVRDDQIPYFRPTVPDARLHRFSDRIRQTVSSVQASFGGITTTKSHEAPSIMTSVKKAISTAMSHAGDILPFVLKLGKTIL